MLATALQDLLAKLMKVKSKYALRLASHNLLRDNAASFDIIALYFRCRNVAHIPSRAFVRDITDEVSLTAKYLVQGTLMS